MDDWEVLGVARGASSAEVRARWLQLVKQLHPDTHDDRAAAARLADVNAAYDRLRLADPASDPASDPAADPATAAATATAPGAGRATAPDPAADGAPARTFAVDDFRPVVFEAVLLAAVDVGDVTHANEPFSLDMWVGGGSCHVELVSHAGGSVVSVDCVNVDAGTVAAALASALAGLGYGVVLGD